MLAFVAALIATPAQAQQRCAATPDVLEHLQKKYSESIRYQGVGSDGSLFMILASESGSWTVIVLPAKGLGRIACLALGGERISEGGSVITMSQQDSVAQIRIAQNGSWTLTIDGKFIINGDGWQSISPVKPAGFKI